MNPHDSVVRVALDAGQGFLKVTLNVFDPKQKKTTASLDNSGVKRCFILAIVEDVSVNNLN